MSSSIVTKPNTQIQNEGSEGEEISGDLNVLQKHVAYFDKNNDGIIYPWETYTGFRAIGCGVALSAFCGLFVNIGFSGSTLPPGKSFSLLFPIYVENIQRAKHGSDSGAYDTEGRFVPSKFEDIFQKHAHTYPNALTSEEVKGLLKANREPKDYRGWLAAWVEWKLIFFLGKDKDGLLQKETARASYDGSLFPLLEKEVASKRKAI